MIVVDKNEMYSRKDALRITGIPADQTESNTQLEDKVINIAEKIGVKISRSDISVTHRLKPTKNGAHPVICKFMGIPFHVMMTPGNKEKVWKMCPQTRCMTTNGTTHMPSTRSGGTPRR